MDKEWLRHLRDRNKPRPPRPLTEEEIKSRRADNLGDLALKYQYYYPRKWKRDAVEITEKAAGEYFDEAQQIIKKRGGYANLGSIDRLKVDGLRALSGFNYYVSSVAKYLGPDTGSEYVSSIASIPAGAGKAVVTKVPKAAKLVIDGIHAYEVGHLAKKAAAKELERIKNSHKQTSFPVPHREPFKQHPWSQIGVQPQKKPVHRPVRARQEAPGYSFLDPVKVADWSLQTHRDPIQRPTAPSDPFMPVTKRLQQIENRAQARLNEQRRVNTLMNKFEKSISHPQPLNAHQQMRAKYGAKIDSIAQKATFSSPGPPVHLSKQEYNSLQRRINQITNQRPSYPSTTQQPISRRGALGSISQGLNQPGGFTSPTIPQRSRPTNPQLGSLKSLSQGLYKR
jgi:hypothetical protein